MGWRSYLLDSAAQEAKSADVMQRLLIAALALSLIVALPWNAMAHGDDDITAFVQVDDGHSASTADGDGTCPGHTADVCCTSAVGHCSATDCTPDRPVLAGADVARGFVRKPLRHHLGHGRPPGVEIPPPRA